MKRKKDDVGGMNLDHLLQDKDDVGSQPIPDLGGGVESSQPVEAGPEPAPPVEALPEKAETDGTSRLVQQLAERMTAFTPGDLVETVELHDAAATISRIEGITAEQQRVAKKVAVFFDDIAGAAADDEDEAAVKRLAQELSSAFASPETVTPGPAAPPAEPSAQDTGRTGTESVSAAVDVLHSFVQESHDHLEDIEQRILDLETQPSPDLVNAIFRSVHTIKGTSSIIGLTHIEELSHLLESVLDELRDDKLTVTADLVDVLLDGSDRLNRMILEVESEAAAAPVVDGKVVITDSGTEIGDIAAKLKVIRGAGGGETASAPAEQDYFDELVTPDMIEKFVSESSDMLDAMEKDVLELERNAGDRTLLDNVFRTVHTIKGNAGFIGYQQIETVCMGTESLLDDVRREKKEVNAPLVNLLLHTVDTMRHLFAAAPEQARASIDSGDTEMPDADRPLGEILLEMGAVTQETLDAALDAQDRRLGEILLEQGTVPPETLSNALAKQKKIVEKGRDRLAGISRKDIRVDMVRLDRLFDLVGELITSEALVVDHPAAQSIEDDGYEKAVSYLTKVSREMQEITMTLRMIPLEGLFNKMNRLVRDLSRRFGKKINFRVTGTQTEMDRNVIEVIADPLVHIIRNAIDHGLEDREARKRAGKNEIGTVRLSAKYEGNEIWVSVSDDGAGLDRERILERAAERDLLKKDAEDMSDTDIWELIFEPGFSTAENVSEISGRGVGMDVVRKNLDKLRGTISIESTQSVGTEIVLKIPMTLAIIDGITARIADTILAIPIGDILEFQKSSKDHITSTDATHDVLRLRDELIPVVYPDEFFNIERPDDYDREGIFIVIHSNERKMALLADDILGYRQIVVKALPSFMGKTTAISGCSVLGNGEVSLILDTNSLIKEMLE